MIEIWAYALLIMGFCAARSVVLPVFFAALILSGCAARIPDVKRRSHRKKLG